MWLLRSSRRGLGVGHRCEPLEPYGFVGSGGGFGARLNGDGGRGVPRPRLGLAGGGGGLWGVDDGGARWGEGGSGCGGWGVLAWVCLRVWDRAGALVLLSYLLWFLGLCGEVLVLLLLVVVVVLLLRVV